MKLFDKLIQKFFDALDRYYKRENSAYICKGMVTKNAVPDRYRNPDVDALLDDVDRVLAAHIEGCDEKHNALKGIVLKIEF